MFRPHRAVGVIVGGAMAAWALLLAILVANLAWGADAEFRTALAWFVAALLTGLALVFANWTFALYTLAYSVERDALVISWGFRRVVVPIESIQRMVPGRTIDLPRVDGLNWWGSHVGVADVPRIGYTLFYSTHNTADDLLYVVTDGEAYAISVVDQAGFAESIQARAALGPLGTGTHRTVASGLGALPFWRDRIAVGTALASVIACALMVGFVFARYPGLPDVVQLSFPELGGIVRIGNKSELLNIAQVGVLILVVNLILGALIHIRERAAGLWMFASAGLLQLVLLGAAVIAFQNA